MNQNRTERRGTPMIADIAKPFRESLMYNGRVVRLKPKCCSMVKVEYREKGSRRIHAAKETAPMNRMPWR